MYAHLVELGGSVSSAEMAAALGTSPVLMRRLLRSLAAQRHVDEVGVEGFAANKFTKAFTTDKGVCGARFSYVVYRQSASLRDSELTNHY